jgi:hypothetical protein
MSKSRKDFEKLPKDQRLGNQPIEGDSLQDFMVKLMGMVDDILNGPKETRTEKEMGVIMLFFPYGDKQGRTNYISNGANRGDVVRMFEEQIRRFKTDSDDDRQYIEHAASLIQDICMVDGKPVVNEVTAIAAAAACMVAYRQGPEAWAKGSSTKQ